MIEITQYSHNESKRWNEFIACTRNATFLFNRGFMDYHSDRFADCSLMAWHKGKLMAVMPANAQGRVLYSHQGLTYGGWLVPLKHFDAVIMLHIMTAGCHWAREHGFETLVYKPVPHIYHSYPAEEDLYALFRHQARLIESNLSTTIALNAPLPFDRGNKSALNLAAKAGVEVKESDDWEQYWHLLDNVLQEHHSTHPVHSLEELKLLHSRFPQNIKLYTAMRDGDMVAGVVVFYTGQVAHCQYIASNHKGREMKALPILFDHLIKEAQHRGLAYFDFGISNEAHGTILNEGLVQQKSRLGGRGIVYNTYQIDL